jgi:hypothetical protein
VLTRRNLKPLARLSTRGEGFARARSLDLLRDTPSRAPRLRSGYRASTLILRSCAFDPRDAFGRTLQPTLSKTSTRARCGSRSAGENESRAERRALCSNGSKARFGRLFLPRRASVIGSLTRAFRADLWRPVTCCASADPAVRAQLPRGRSRSLPPTATLNGTGFPDPGRLPSTRNRAGSSRSRPSILAEWRERSRRSFALCGFTAPG